MSQKVENILNLALDATSEERARSGDLSVGYNPEAREWELIVYKSIFIFRKRYRQIWIVLRKNATYYFKF